MIRRRSHLTYFIGTTLFLPAFLFASIPPVFATCCKCAPKDNPKTTTCIQTGKPDCGQLVESKNALVKNLDCTASLTEGQCKTVPEGGICTDGPQEEVLYAPPGQATVNLPDEEPTYKPPVLGVSIPGLKFAENIEIGGGRLRIPWFAQYVSAFQTYLVGISIVAAAILLVYGGMLYIVGSAAGTVQKGKAIVTDALIGLVLVLGAYVILATLNPELVSPEAQNLQIVSRREAFTDPAQERQRVEESATVKSLTQDEEVPVVILGQPEQPPGAEAPSVPGAALTGPPGTVVKDAAGNLVAQGNCPIDMAAVRFSEEYKKKRGTIASFCMDLFEAPNIKGEKPFLGAMEWEAEWWCNERGKRLCTLGEWQRACMGPKADNLYGYGPTFIPGLSVTAGNPPDSSNWYALKKGSNEKAPCNYDTEPRKAISWGNLQQFYIKYPTKTPEESILNEKNPKLSDAKYKKSFDIFKKEVADMESTEPSGSRPRCVTAEGVFDMSGNVAEMVVKDEFAGLTAEQRISKGPVTSGAKPYTWAGFYWAPIAHKATSQAEPKCTFAAGGPHGAGIGWRDYANGFRCCMGLIE